MEIFLIIIFIIGLLTFLSIKIVPEQQAWILEHLGKYHQTLKPGLNIIIPFIQKVAYQHTLKEQAINVHEQTAISNDNVALSIDGVLYVRVTDPFAASYGVSDPYYAVIQLAQTTMRSEIGKITLDKTFEERILLNTSIVTAINHAATNWGIECLRYEIKDITPPKSILQSMELQVAAERQKRAVILESEGRMQAEINKAEAEKAQIVLSSEAAYTDKVNRAKGESEAIILVAQASAKGIDTIANSIEQKGGNEAVSLKIAEQYIQAFSKVANNANTVLLPANLDNPSSMIAQAMTVFENIKNNKK